MMLKGDKYLYGSFSHQEHRIFSILPSWPLQLCYMGLIAFSSLTLVSHSALFEWKPSLQRDSAESSATYPVLTVNVAK